MAFSRSSAPRRTTPDKPSMIPSPTLILSASKRSHFLGSARTIFKKDKVASHRTSSRPSISDPVLFRNTRDDLRHAPSQGRATVPEPTKKAGSPADKPLPGLPIASFVRQSPQRRTSLLDALDQPLRKIVTSDTTEEWPALQPVRLNDGGPLATPVYHRTQNTTDVIKPSLGESIIEQMEQLRVTSVSDTSQRDVSSTPPSMGFLEAPWSAPATQRYPPAPGEENVLDTNSRAPSSYNPPRKFSLHRLSLTKSRQSSIQEHRSEVRDLLHDLSNATGTPSDTASTSMEQCRMVSLTGSPDFFTHQPEGNITHRKHRCGKAKENMENDLTFAGASATTPDPSHSIQPVIEATTNGLAHAPLIQTDVVERFQSIPFPTFDELNGPGPGTNDFGDRWVRARTLTATSYAGTTYGDDEHGSYRMKPVSVADPKHGPRARIDRSADRLLLGDQAKLGDPTDGALSNDGAGIPSPQHELDAATHGGAPHQTTVMEGTKVTPKGLRRVRGSLQLSDFERIEATDTNMSKSTGTSRTPSQVLVIPDIDLALTAPFSSVNPERDDRIGDRYAAIDHKSREGLSTSSALETHGLIGHELDVVVTPEMQRAESMLKIASLTGVPAEQLFPPRTSSVLHKHKPKNGQVESAVQLPIKHSNDYSNSDAVCDIAGSTPLQKFKHMQTFEHSARAHNVGSGMEIDLPYSPPETSGIVSSSTGKIITNIKGLFHKKSTDSQFSPAATRVRRRLTSNTKQAELYTADLLKPSKLHTSTSLRPHVSTSSTITEDERRARTANSPSTTRRFPSLTRLGRDSPDHNKLTSSPTFVTNQTPSLRASPLSIVSATDCPETQAATKLAYHLLDKASSSIEPPQQDQLIDLARLLVQAITHCRAAEKAAAEAKSAAAKAEVEVGKLREVLAEITGVVAESGRGEGDGLLEAAG